MSGRDVPVAVHYPYQVSMTKTAGQILAGSLDMDRDIAQVWSRHQVGAYFINKYLCLRFFLTAFDSDVYWRANEQMSYNWRCASLEVERMNGIGSLYAPVLATSRCGD